MLQIALILTAIGAACVSCSFPVDRVDAAKSAATSDGGIRAFFLTTVAVRQRVVLFRIGMILVVCGLLLALADSLRPAPVVERPARPVPVTGVAFSPFARSITV